MNKVSMITERKIDGFDASGNRAEWELNALKQNNFTDIELIDEFKDYKNLIEYAIDLFDITFNYYIKKLEPEILRYYVTLYHNRNYTEEFESTEDCKFTLMIKGLRKMCIALIKNKFSYYS